MGCSPSKGKLLSKPHPFGVQKAPGTDELREGVDCRPALDEDVCLKPQDKEEEVSLLRNEETSLTRLDSDPTVPENATDIKTAKVNETPQEIIGDVAQTHTSQKMETPKRNVRKRSTERERKPSAVLTKVDFPPHMVRAHQAAYSFLNPNISKYEALLGLLDQAAQTQLSLQPIISALGLFFEEINQALEEMAEEGEQMLKEHGDSMTLPSGMLGQAMWSAKPSSTAVDNFDPPPDLLHQLLQHSSEKLQQVQSSVTTLSDATLKEAIEYFSSLSKLFFVKLQTKKAAELRLARVLARIETSVTGKSNPEDSALHSEDSGIGGENESLTGSEKHHRHRGSAESGTYGCEVNVWGVFQNHSNEEEEEDAGKYESYENGHRERKRSSSSPPDPGNALRYLHANSIKHQQSTFRRLPTATDVEPSSSNSSLNGRTELQNTHEMQGLNSFVRPPCNLHRAGLRRHSLNESAGMRRIQVRTHHPPGSSPPNKPLKPHSVRRLINTFSQGDNGRPGQGLSHIQSCITKPSKTCILPVNKTGEETVSTSSPDGRDDLDMDNLPPPPLEVLMDNSFHYIEKLHQDPVLNLPLVHQNSGIFQRRKIALQNVEILPNKANVKPKSGVLSTTPPIRQERVTEVQQQKPQQDTEMSEQTEKTKRSCKQARKTITVHNGEEASDGKALGSEVPACSLPVIAPPVSRVRLPPSCPSVRNSYPSPPIFRPHPNSGSCSRSNSPRPDAIESVNNTEYIVPFVSFHDARSVFCQNELQSSQPGVPFGSSVLPRKWGEVSRSRSSTRGRDNPSRRTQSEQRPGTSSYSELETDCHIMSQQTKEDEPAGEP